MTAYDMKTVNWIRRRITKRDTSTKILKRLDACSDLHTTCDACPDKKECVRIYDYLIMNRLVKWDSPELKIGE